MDAAGHVLFFARTARNLARVEDASARQNELGDPEAPPATRAEACERYGFVWGYALIAYAAVSGEWCACHCGPPP